MSESDDEGPGGDKPQGPLGDTFGEFVTYARNRRKKGPRQAPPARPGRQRSETTVRQAKFAAVTVVCFFVIFLVVRALVGPAAGPAAGPGTRVRVSTWIDLPRPSKMGEVPDGWGKLKLGMRLQDLPATQRAPHAGGDMFADMTFVPDPAQPDAWFGLSFYKERLYRVAVRYGETSKLEAGPYLELAGIAYGRHRGYEYPTQSARHVVTIFQTETRALKFDSVKTPEEISLSEVVLVDLEQGAARELARARGK